MHLDRDRVGVEGGDGVDAVAREEIERGLMALHPWRKGPFEIHGVVIDAEWRADLKWRRLAPHITPLEGRLVLDVGCGNGYYGWRMAGAGAAMVVGVDPHPLYWTQFLALRHFLGGGHPFFFFPVGFEALLPGVGCFDTVFSMGLLYHRRSPFDHLLALREQLRPGGELVLETLVLEEGAGELLVPPGRYAKMRNVWFIPSAAMLRRWLERAGFRRVRLVDETRTTSAEQRVTPWMRFESLADFLDPTDPRRTVEGHPAPLRALLIARR